MWAKCMKSARLNYKPYVHAGEACTQHVCNKNIACIRNATRKHAYTTNPDLETLCSCGGGSSQKCAQGARLNNKPYVTFWRLACKSLYRKRVETKSPMFICWRLGAQGWPTNPMFIKRRLELQTLFSQLFAQWRLICEKARRKHA